MSEGVLSESLARDYNFLNHYIENNQDKDIGRLLESRHLRFYLIGIEKVAKELSARGVPAGAQDAVSAATEGFMFSLGVAWQLEPAVQLKQIDQRIKVEQAGLESLYENIMVNAYPNAATERWDKFSENGLSGIPGMHRLLSHAAPELGFGKNTPEVENILYWGGIGSQVFLDAARQHYVATFSQQMKAIDSDDVRNDWA